MLKVLNWMITELVAIACLITSFGPDNKLIYFALAVILFTVNRYPTDK